MAMKQRLVAARRSTPVGLLAATIFVTALVLLNLETLFPTSRGGDGGSEGHRLRLRALLKEDLNWPTSSYFEQSNRKKSLVVVVSSFNVSELTGRSDKTRRLPGRLGVGGDEVFECDRSHPRTDVCHMKGDVRIHKGGSFVLYAANQSTRVGTERIKPYTRKWEQGCMDMVHEVELRSVPVQQLEDEHLQQPCEVRHSVPAVVMTTGGYTGNVYHEFHDGLIPLFITLQHLQREVVIVVVEYHAWWQSKYEDVLRQLTRYPLLDLEAPDTRRHCFPEVTVGLHIHDELTVEPSLMPHGESIRDFRALLDRAYSSDPEVQQLQLQLQEVQLQRTKPRMVMVIRNDTRVILNLEELVSLAEGIGLDVQLLQPGRTSELSKIYQALNASEIMVGVHGAAMTHFLFMRPGSVFVQIIPLGTTWAADAYYGQPAKKLGLNYVGYQVEAYESSLSGKYPKNHTVLTNPQLVSDKGGWSAVKRIYLEGQDVMLSPARFRRTLLKAKAKAEGFMRKHKHHHS